MKRDTTGNSMHDAFEHKKDAPLWWLNKSSDLHASAGCLWLAMGDSNERKFLGDLNLGKGFSLKVACVPVYRMLFGMSLELMFKAVAVVSGKEPEHSHNLCELAKAAGIQYSDSQLELLAYLSHCIVWTGRYPVPKKRQTFEEHYNCACHVLMEEHKLGRFTFMRYNNACNWESLNPLWVKGMERFFDIYEGRDGEGRCPAGEASV